MGKKGWFGLGIILSLFLIGGFVVIGVIMDWEKKKMEKVLPWNQQEVGSVVDEYKGVPVFENGLNYTQSHGKNYHADGYYYGYKWQCVEYVKRFYYDAKGHAMPNLYGNSKDYFDNTLPQGTLNKERGLYQYRNGGNVKPKPDDLLVFQNGLYGHVAIITKVQDDFIEVIQQNIYAKPRETFKLKEVDENYFIGDGKQPIGWLRIGD